MLVLTRKAKQRIQIGDNISITVLRVKGQTVRIGIDAPTEIRVRRSELAIFDAAANAADAEARPVVSTTIAGSASSDSASPSNGKSPPALRSVSEREEGLSHPFRSNSRVHNRTKNIQRESQTDLSRRTEELLVRDRHSSDVMGR